MLTAVHTFLILMHKFKNQKRYRQVQASKKRKEEKTQEELNKKKAILCVYYVYPTARAEAAALRAGWLQLALPMCAPFSVLLT